MALLPFTNLSKKRIKPLPDDNSPATAPAETPKPPLTTGGYTDSPFNRVPIEITVSVGKARPLIRDLIALGQDSILPLDRKIDDTVELFVGERLIARGNLVELDGDQTGRLAVCLTEVSELAKAL